MQLPFVVLLGILVVTAQKRPPQNSETSNVVTFDVNNLKSLLHDGEVEIKNWNKDRATFFLGVTGAGKSTTIKFITGSDNNLLTKKVRGLYVFTDGNKKIGDGTFKSKTLVPELTYDNKSKLSFIDCPGFGDTKKLSDPTFDIATNYFIKKSLDSMKYVRFVLVIVHSSLVTGNERHGFINLLQYICTLINDVNKFKNSISIVINKVSGDISDIEEIGYSADFMIEAKEYIKSQVTNTSAPKDIKKFNDMSSLIDIITLNTTDKIYPNIGIFRKPKTEDLNSQVMKKNKEDLRQLIISKDRLIYTETGENDFSYYLSAKSKIQVHNILFPEFTRQATTIVANISDEITNLIQKKLNNMEIGPQKLEYIARIQNIFYTYLRPKDIYSKDDVQKLIDSIKVEFKDSKIPEYITSLEVILEHLQFCQMVSAINNNYYILIGLNCLEPINNNITEIYDTKIKPDIENLSFNLLEVIVNEIKQSLNSTFTSTNNLTVLMDLLYNTQNIYENFNKMNDTLDNSVYILSSLKDNFVSTNTKSSINNLIDIFKKMKLFIKKETTNFRTNGISKLFEVINFLKGLRLETLIEKIKTFTNDVIKNVKKNILNTMNSEFSSYKGIELHLDYAEYNLEYLSNITKQDIKGNIFLNHILIYLQELVKDKILKKDLSESVQILEKYNSFWDSINVESIIVTATEFVTELNNVIKEKTKSVTKSYVSKCIENIATEIKSQIDIKCDELGPSNDLETYLKAQHNSFDKIPLLISTLGNMSNIIVDIGKNIYKIENKKDIAIIKKIMTREKLFQIIYEKEPNYYSAFEVHKLSEIKQKLNEIILWTNFLKDATDYHTTWDQINRLQDNTINYDKNNIYFLLREIDRSNKYPNLRDIKNVPNFVITKLNELVAYVRSSSYCEEGTLTMYGHYLTTQQLKKIQCPEYLKIKTINIFAYEKLYFDGNIKYNHDIQLNIISPVWYVVADAEIYLIGEKGEDHREPKPKTPKNANGIHGSPGKPGYPGGNLIGVGVEFINDYRLRITSQGGKGGQGQLGGDGGDGNPPTYPEPPECKHSSWDGYADTDFNNNNYKFHSDYIYHCNQLEKYDLHLNSDQCNAISRQDGAHFLIRGVDGKKGYPGGNGGAGGKGGLPGQIKIYAGNKNHKIIINHLNGEKGIGNTGGEGGEGELLATRRVIKHSLKSSGNPRFEWIIYKSKIPTDKSPSGLQGRDGKNETNIEDPSPNTFKMTLADVIKAYTYTLLYKNQIKSTFSESHKNLLKELLKIK